MIRESGARRRKEGATERDTAGESCEETGGGGAGVLRVEKENRAKEGEADAHSSQECKSSLSSDEWREGGRAAPMPAGVR